MFSGQAEERRQGVFVHDPSNWEFSYNIKGTSQGSTIMVPGNKLNHRQQTAQAFNE